MKAKANFKNTGKLFQKMLDEYQITTYRLGKMTGTDPTKFIKIVNGETAPSFSTLADIKEVIPSLNINFLITGQLPIRHAEETFYTTDTSFIDVPFVPVKAYATFAESGQSATINDLTTIKILKDAVSNVKKPIVIEVAGDSMSERINDGDRILMEEMDPSEWEYLSNGTFVFVYRSYVVVKRLKESIFSTGGIFKLYSDNPKFTMMEVRVDDVRHLYKVHAIVYSKI